MRKPVICIAMVLTIYTYAQNNIDNIKITYSHLSAKSDFPKLFRYSFDTYLTITDSISQYLFNRKARVVRNGNYQTRIRKHKYTNNYYFKNDSVAEQRELKKGKLKAGWKPDYHWKISDETKTIHGYLVKKATTNSIEVDPDNPAYYGKVIAWFTEEIPIPVGPDRYYGLPGLILALEYENSVKKTTLKSIEFNKKIKLIAINKGIMVNDKFDVIYFYHKNPELVGTLLKK